MTDYKEAVRLFVLDCLLPDTKARTSTTDLFPIYQVFCEQCQFPDVAITVFGRELGRYIHNTRQGGTRRYWCRLKPELVVLEPVPQGGQ